MNIAKAVVTAAGSDQRNLPLQNLIDRDGTEKSLLRIIVEEALRGGVEVARRVPDLSRLRALIPATPTYSVDDSIDGLAAAIADHAGVA